MITKERKEMLKRLMWLLSLTAILSFTSCGGGSDEAKELLQRLLRLVGIPHDIVVNICQDDNNNGFCEKFELQAKVTINKNDNLSSIFQKVSLTKDGQYLLENYDPAKKIIMELQDSATVHYNDGKFTLNYSPKTEELSILQAMIDANHLTTDDVKAVREMNNVDDFYEVLLTDFEINLNILGDNELSSSRAVTANVKEIAEELLANGIVKELPQNINGCDGNQSCINEELKLLSEELKIDENESEIIRNSETENHKKILANKIVYRVYNEHTQVMQMIFNADVTLFHWEIIEGTGEGDQGVSNITVIESSKLTSDSFSGTYLSGADDFLLYENETNKEKEKFYFDKNRAKLDTWSGKIEFYENNRTISIPVDTKIRITPSEEQNNDNWGGIVLSLDNSGTWATHRQSFEDINILHYTDNSKYQFIVSSEETMDTIYDFYNCADGYLMLNRNSLDEIEKSTAQLSDFNHKTIKVITHEQECNSLVKISDLINGKVTFYNELNQIKPIPSDAHIRIVPSRFQNEDSGWEGLACTIDSNGSFGDNCYTHEERGVRDAFADDSETYAIQVYKNSVKPDDVFMYCADDLYKAESMNQPKNSWNTIDVYPNDYVHMDSSDCDET